MVGIDEMGGQGKVILLDLCIISLCIISQVCIVFIIKKIPYNKFDYRTSAIPHTLGKSVSGSYSDFLYYSYYAFVHGLL